MDSGGAALVAQLSQFIFPVLLILVARFVGAATEKRHYESIHAREKAFLARPAVTVKQFDTTQTIADSRMVTGSVVISIDHFKRFMSSFRLLFGGELHSFSPLIDRGRREALLQMKESYPDADIYLNTRLETSTISGNSGRNAVGTVEVVAYATAIKFAQAQLPAA